MQSAQHYKEENLHQGEEKNFQLYSIGKKRNVFNNRLVYCGLMNWQKKNNTQRKREKKPRIEIEENFYRGI